MSEEIKDCELDCQCSELITDTFRINSGNSATKRRREEANSLNYKSKMFPHALDFGSSPQNTPSKRRILGDIQNSPLLRLNAQFCRLNSSKPTFNHSKSPFNKENNMYQENAPNGSLDETDSFARPNIQHSPLLTQNKSYIKRSSMKISRILQERSHFKMSENKENEILSSESFQLNVEEETRDSFGLQTTVMESKVTKWSKLDFTDALQTKSYHMEKSETMQEVLVPESNIEPDLDPDFETLHDLDQELESDNFEACNKYEIISTDSPNIISRGRSTTRKVTSKNFTFGAPLSDSEPSTSFNRPTPNATRMLNFEEETFEFASPAAKKPSLTNTTVKKSLKFNETPTKNFLRHDLSESSIGSMSSSPASSKLRIFPSESTASLESGFVSEHDENLLENECTNSPKVTNFTNLLSGQINESNNIIRRPLLHRSISLNHDKVRAKMSLFSILESPEEKKSQKRSEPSEVETVANKRMKPDDFQEDQIDRQRPVLHRAFSESNASIMSALARSVVDPDLIGDFTQPFALPLTSGNQTDLKYISCDTLAELLKGQFQESIGSYQVIDCRYPYEYEGGHISGAVNLYTPDQIQTLVNKPLQTREIDEKRDILVFHCEFSLERGPKLSRFLRSTDRAKNKDNYPSLHYPEVYVLHEGYRAFFKRHPDMCTPAGYTAMLDPRHRHLLRQHRSLHPPTTSSNHKRHRLLF